MGRAHHQLNPIRDSYKAYDCFQEAVYRLGDCLDYWVPIGVLVYTTGQLLDSLNALARAIRLNPNVWESWYNLGHLVNTLSLKCRKT